MKKIKEYHICDRCKSVIKKEEINEVFDYAYHYELCDLCKHEYDEFTIHVNALKRNWERLEEKHKFGKYLPEESHRDYYKLNENNILVESEKIYYIDELIG